MIKKRYTFQDLYNQHKKNHRGLNPNPTKRGKENPNITLRAEKVMHGVTLFEGFPLIVLAMAYPTSLNNSFKDIGIDVSHWIRRYS